MGTKWITIKATVDEHTCPYCLARDKVHVPQTLVDLPGVTKPPWSQCTSDLGCRCAYYKNDEQEEAMDDNW